tara:strand:- start:76 stop:330 length:255 start_codon:yes stop_codon:yes gene_type:complete
MTTSTNAKIANFDPIKHKDEQQRLFQISQIKSKKFRVNKNIRLIKERILQTAEQFGFQGDQLRNYENELFELNRQLSTLQKESD